MKRPTVVPAAASWEQGRILYLIRHGQYDTSEGPSSGRLTGLGRRQAKRLAKHFAGHTINSIVSSDLPRAIETADILAAELGFDQVKRYRVLREVLPVRVPNMSVPLEKRAEGKRRLEAIAARFFKTSIQTRREIVVCHGNLIRSLVCRFTGAPLSRFPEMLVHHAGVTCFIAAPKGIQLVSYNVIEHLPASMRSYR